MARRIGSRTSRELQALNEEHLSEAIDLMVERMKDVPGLIALHGQYAAFPPALVVALVESGEARHSVRQVEDLIFEEDPLTPIDLIVDEIDPQDVASTLAALKDDSGLLWMRSEEPE